jgi:hypothetical protein
VNELDLDGLRRIITGFETERIEFKSADFLNDTEEISAQLVAFANRNGGKILVGVKNDGTIEGTKIDYDATSLNVLNIAHNNCSPRVELSFDFLASDGGDVLAIDVLRRKGIPVAVVERRGPEIKRRTYYIRTGAGKRLVDDGTLRFMFNSIGDPQINGNFRICLWYDRMTLNLCPFQYPRYVSNLLPFLTELNTDDVKFILEREVERIQGLLVNIMPYALTYHLAWTFPHSWSVEVQRRHDITTVSSSRTDLPSKAVSYLDIPVCKGNVLSQLSLDLASNLKMFVMNFKLPRETSVEIDLAENSSSLRLRNPVFVIEVKFTASIWSVGLPFPVVSRPLLDPQESQTHYAQSTIITNISGKYDFPAKDDPEFEDHYLFGKTILDLLQNDWEWEAELRRIKESQTYEMNRNVTKILSILQK